MVICMSNVLVLCIGSYQVFKERVEVEEKGFVFMGVVCRCSIRLLKGGLRIGLSFFEVCVLRSSGVFVVLFFQKKMVGLDVLMFFVCCVGVDGGFLELEFLLELLKFKESFKLLFRLVWFFFYCSFYFFLIRGFFQNLLCGIYIC